MRNHRLAGTTPGRPDIQNDNLALERREAALAASDIGNRDFRGSGSNCKAWEHTCELGVQCLLQRCQFTLQLWNLCDLRIRPARAVTLIHDLTALVTLAQTLAHLDGTLAAIHLRLQRLGANLGILVLLDDRGENLVSLW